MSKDKTTNKQKLIGLITIIGFGALLLTAIVFYAALGSFALITRILFIASAAAFVAAVVLNWEIITSMFKQSASVTGIYKTVQFVIILGVLVFLYIISDTLAWKLDFTSSRLYSFSDQTKETLASITNEMDILLFRPGFYISEPLVQYQETLLTAYAEKNPMINLEVIDPEVNPSRAIEYDVDDPGTVVIDYEGNRDIVEFSEIYELDSTTGDLTYKGEIAYTAAIKGLLESKKKLAYVLTGHGEINWADTGLYGFSELATLIQSDMITMDVLNLTRYPEVPTDCGVLIIADPQSGITLDELDKIKNYISEGGSVFAMLEYNSDFMVNDVLYNMGIFFRQNLAVDLENYMPAGGNTMLVPNIQPYADITSPLLANSYAIILNHAGALERLDADLRMEGYTYYVSPLLLSSVNSFAELDETQIVGTPVYNEGEDLDGPLTLAFASKRVEELMFSNDNEVTTNKIEARMVAIGDTSFANNNNIEKYGNSDFILNSLNFLLKRDSDITTRPKESGMESYVLTSQAKRVMTVILFSVVLIYLGVGITIVVTRRRTVKETTKTDK